MLGDSVAARCCVQRVQDFRWAVVGVRRWCAGALGGLGQGMMSVWVMQNHNNDWVCVKVLE
jgi:hypothetical protein